MLNEEYDRSGYDFCNSCRKTVIENNEMVACDATGKCPYVDMVLPEYNGEPFMLFDENETTADVFLTALRMSERKQYTFTTKKGEYFKFIPTLSELGVVLDNLYSDLTEQERSDIIYRISKMYPVFFNMRART